MRFSTVISSLAVAAAVVSAAPASKKRSGDIETVGKGICFLEAGLGVTSIEDFADDVFGGAITALENELGVTDLDEAFGLDSCDWDTSGKSDVYLVGEGLCYIEKGSGITSIDDFLNEESGGAIDALESALGITSLEEALGLSGC